MKKILAASAVIVAMAIPAWAGDYPWKPTKPITIIVPWGAGGATDQVTRVTAGILEEELGQSVVIIGFAVPGYRVAELSQLNNQTVVYSLVERRRAM